MNLRLNRLAEMVDPGSRLADIGTDHAYLPILLVKSGKISHAIASDVAAGPLENAKTDIAAAGLSDQIETRLGSGLETIKESDQIDTVVIAGMGGKLMVNLLSEAASRGVYYPNLVLEANIGEKTVRRWLMANKYEIVAEDIVYEAGHIYELIKARLTDQVHELTVREQEFGPLLLKNKTDVFYKKWQGQEAYYQKLLANLNKAREKDLTRIKEVENLLAMIKTELGGEND